MDLEDFKWLDDLTGSAPDLEELGKMADCLSKEAIKLENEEASGAMVGAEQEDMEPPGTPEPTPEDEPAAYVVKDEYIIITVPTDTDEDMVCTEDGVLLVDHDMKPLCQDHDVNDDSSSSISVASPSRMSDCETDYFVPSNSDSDLGYDSLDSPESNNLKMLFPELL